MLCPLDDHSLLLSDSNLTFAEKFVRVMEGELGGSWRFLLL